MPLLTRRRASLTPLFVTLLVVLGVILSFAERPAHAADASVKLDPSSKVVKLGRATGLPLPRYASLKFKKTNLRVGPGTKYGVSWAYKRKGMPVEIIQEFDNWRRIRDFEGTTGWVLHSLLSARRTAIVAPWKRNFNAEAGADLAQLALLNGKDDASRDSRTIARLQPGLQVGVESCQSGWCAVKADAVKAWLPQEKLWGVYRDEQVGG